MSTQMKAGHMLRYKKRLFKADWREEYVILLEDSTLQWYKDEGQADPDGKMILSEAPELLAFGLFAERVPKRPELPEGYSSHQLLTFGEKTDYCPQWFLCKSSDDVMSWMTAISNTLPTIIPEVSKKENSDDEESGEDENLKSEDSVQSYSSTNHNALNSLPASSSLASSYTFCCGYGLGSGWGWFIDADGVSVSSVIDSSEGPPTSPSSNFRDLQGEYLEFDYNDHNTDFTAF